MTNFDIVKRSGRNLKNAKIRTVLTALAIGVGGFTLVLTLAAGNGLRDYTDKLVSSNFDPTELFVGRDPEVANNGTPSEKPKEFDESVSNVELGGGGSGSIQIKRVTKHDVDEIRSQDYIENVRESYQINVRYITRKDQKKYTASAEAYNPAQKPEIKAGELPGSGDIQKGTILLPDSYIEPLGFSDSKQALGKKVTLSVAQPFSISSLQRLLTGNLAELAQQPTGNFEPQERQFTYTVGAITKASATSLAFGVIPLRISSLDARELYDYTTRGTTDYEKYLFVFARVKQGSQETELATAKSDLESKGYYVQSSKDIQKTITQFVNILQIMVGVFGLITVIASVFGIINTQYISVLERTKEIGLMKALGMHRREISRLFMFEATWIGFIGGVIGSGVGFLVGVLLNPFITKKLDLGEGNNLIVFQPVQIVLLIIALMLVATIAGMLPARKAAKLDPIEALRTE